MSSLTLTATNYCAADNHFTLTVTGDVSHVETFDLDDITAPVTPEERRAFLRVLLRVAKIGRTRNQVKTALTNGHTVTV